jgi:hypothetical protein
MDIRDAGSLVVRNYSNSLIKLRVSRKNLGINYQRIFLEKVIFES